MSRYADIDGKRYTATRRGTPRTNTRMRKVICPTCGTMIRLSRQTIAEAMPLCGRHGCANYGSAMVCADPADAIECGLMSLDELPRTLRTQICRANGWEDEIVRTSASQSRGSRKPIRIREPEPIPF